MKKIINYIIILLLVFCGSGFASEVFKDPWVKLQERFKTDEKESVSSNKVQPDQLGPWEKLRAIFLPFSLKEEGQAVLDPVVAKTVGQKINNRLLQYESIIKKASQKFNIPEVIIKSVIMAESGGNSDAKAKTTSAKGLMQTIDSTFKMSKKGLAKQKIEISDNPFDPESSIMAGTWYLDRMYKKAVKDKKINNISRDNIASWRYPLEYYYAGPGNGAKVKNKILVFSNGTKRIIDKRAYSTKIQKWARILDV